MREDIKSKIKKYGQGLVDAECAYERGEYDWESHEKAAKQLLVEIYKVIDQLLEYKRKYEVISKRNWSITYNHNCIVAYSYCSLQTDAEEFVNMIGGLSTVVGV